MRKLNSNSWLWIVIGAWLVFLWFGGGRSIDPQKLPGVWLVSDRTANVSWIFSPDGEFRYQVQFQNGWIGKLGGNFDIGGHWKLDHKKLTIELSETPPMVELWGGNWKGQSASLQIRRLTNEELSFSDSELKFRRSLASVRKSREAGQ